MRVRFGIFGFLLRSLRLLSRSVSSATPATQASVSPLAELRSICGKRGCAEGAYRVHMHTLRKSSQFGFLTLSTMFWLSAATAYAAGDRGRIPPVTTLVVFSDKPLPQALWGDLRESFDTEVSSARYEEQSHMRRVASREQRFHPGSYEIVRGDEAVGGIIVQSSISIYLHGNCDPAQPRRPFSDGRPLGKLPLGWVKESGGEIQPFIHVDCDDIQLVLWQRMIGCNYAERKNAMGRAVARVMVHEWIHIASQSAHHARRGVAKAQFSANDLVAEERDFFSTEPRHSGTSQPLRAMP